MSEVEDPKDWRPVDPSMTANLGSLNDQVMRDLLNKKLSDPLNRNERLGLIGESLVVGTVTDGYKEITQNPGRLAAEGVGAYALMLAMKGPAWTKIPAMAVATVGTLAFGKQVVDAGIETSDILARADRNNLDATRKDLRAVLGPVGFNSVLMAATARLGAHDAARLPLEMPVERLLPSLSPEMSLAGGGRVRLDLAALARGDKKPDIMAMSSHEGVNTSRGVYGEVLHQARLSEKLKSVDLVHSDGTHTSVRDDGKLMVGFTSGEARLVDLGYPVKSVTASDYANGIRHYRFNDAVSPNMEVSAQGHVVKAVTGAGDHLHLVDNTPGSFTYFQHRDGAQSWITESGRVVFNINNRHIEHDFKTSLAHISLLERVDGTKQFRFLGADGKVLPQVVEVPQARSFTLEDERSLLLQLNRQLTRNNIREQRVTGPFEVNRVQTSGHMPGVASQPDRIGGLIPRFPGSGQRVAARALAGVDHRVMRGDNLETPAEMGLAMQNNSWLVSRYLNHLNSHDRNN